MLQTVYLAGKQRVFAKEALRMAALNDGCFIVKNSPFANNPHRIAVQNQLKQFYNLSIEERMSIGRVQGKGATRGYFDIGSESGNKDLVELKESFSFGHQNIPDRFKQQSNLVADNIWHSSFRREHFQSVLESFNQTAREIVDLCSIVDLSKTVDQSSDYQSFIRSFKYHGSESLNPNTTGNSLHSDWNLLTLVWTDQSGFEFLKDDGTYQQVFDAEDSSALICNFGDFTSSLSDGRVRSPWHQVTQPPYPTHRHSLVHFYYPSSTYPAVKKIITHQNRPLGLFVDQSKVDGTLWNVGDDIKDMGQMFSEKWKQISR